MKSVLFTGVALFVLWALSFGLSYVDTGAASVPIALGIAAVKAGLVVLFFMELAHASFTIKMTLVTAAALTAVLMGLMIADVRGRDPAPLVPPGVPIGQR